MFSYYLGDVVFWFQILLVYVAHGGHHEKRLFNHIFNDSRLDGHNILERPISDERMTLDVDFKVSLQQIIDLDEKNQMMNTNIWLDITWYDYHFVWSPIEYGNISKIIIPANKVWRPDILMYNSADERFDGTYPANVVVDNSGLMHMVPPGMFKSTCKINITWFPFDTQSCVLQFGTWTYNGGQVNLKLKCDNDSSCTGVKGNADINYFIPNGEWEIVDVPAEKFVNVYPCCPESPYIDIKFFVKIRRKALYYIFNLITPCIIISTMSLLVFTLPPGAGEKISLGVTIMLSLTMFLFMVADKLPQTSGSVPLIGLYFSCIMIMCSFSVVFTVLVLNCHHKSGEDEEIPYWIKVLVNRWLARLLLMSPRNPQSVSERHPIFQPKRSSSINPAKAYMIKEYLGPKTNINNGTGSPAIANVNCQHHSSSGYDQNLGIRPCTGTNNVYKNPYFKSVICNHSNTKCSILSELENVITELKQITDKVIDEHHDEVRANEWKFAARVIDRVCLIGFALFTTLSTIMILTSAPNVDI